MIKRITAYFSVIYILVTIFGCSESMESIDEQLRHTIEFADKGRILKRIELKAGVAHLEIEDIEYKKTFKDDYTYIAIVTFRESKRARKRGQLPKLGYLPTPGEPKRIRTQFRYLRDEDRWYFHKHL